MNLFKKPLFWIIIIFISSATFRLTNLDLIEFKLDEANALFAAVNFYHEPYLAQHSGVSSTGIYNMPLFYYLVTLFGLIAKTPQIMSFLIAFMNSALVAVFYLVVRRYYGNLTGVLASLLMATSPWMILYSRKIWGPDFIMLFAIPAFYFIHRLIIDKKPGAIFGLSLSLLLLFQLHYSGVTILLITAISLIILKVKISWKWLILGVILAFIPLVPFFSLGSFSCQDCMPPIERVFDSNNLYRGLQIINGGYFENVLGDDYPLFLEQFPLINLFNFLFLFEFLLIFLGGWVVFKDKKLRFLLAFLIIPPIIALLTQTTARMYYYLAVSPFIILIYTLSIGVFKKFKWIGVSIICIVILVNVFFEIMFYQFLSQKQAISGDYGPIYQITKKIEEEKLSQFKEGEDYDLIRADFYVKLFSNQIQY